MLHLPHKPVFCHAMKLHQSQKRDTRGHKKLNARHDEVELKCKQMQIGAQMMQNSHHSYFCYSSKDLTFLACFVWTQH